MKEANYNGKRFPRYVRNKSYNVPLKEEEVISKNLKVFLERKMDASTFNNILRENNINPNIEEVKNLF